MNLSACFRPLSFCTALLLASTSFAASPAAAGGAPSPTATHPGSDAPAVHPNFTVRVVGKGQPVILIPGLTCPGAVWDETVAHYQKQYQCHVVSLAGFGGTAAPASTNPLLLAVRDQLLAYIKTEKLHKPIVIGHSLGGFMALWLSVAQPEAIGPLVIVDSLPFLAAVQNPNLTAEAAKPLAENMRQQARKGGMSAAVQRQMAASMITDTARITQATRWGLRSDPATVAQALYDLYTTDLRVEISGIQQPVLVLGAWVAYQQYGATKESTRAIFEQQYAKLPEHRIEMSEAGKHFLMWDDTNWFFAQTDAFLAQHRVAKK